jgi:hypothetical protein
MILAYQQEHGEAVVLPNHLRILALAQTLADANYGGTIRDIATSPRASQISTGVPESDMSRDDFTVHTQGSVAMKAELQGNCNGNRRGPCGPPRAPPNAALSDHRCNAAPRRSCYQGTCNTCGQWGHPANACNKVGDWAFLCRYHWDRTNTAMIDEVERAWIEKNKPFLRENNKAPRKVFYTCCGRMGLTKNQVIEGMISSQMTKRMRNEGPAHHCHSWCTNVPWTCVMTSYLLRQICSSILPTTPLPHSPTSLSAMGIRPPHPQNHLI